MRPEENSARQRFGGRDLPTFRAAFGARSRASCSRRVMNARSAVAVGLRCRGARYRRRDGQARVDLGEAPVFLNVLAPANTEDDEFRATDSGLFGFLADHDDDDVPFKPFGVVGYGHMTGVLGFSGEAHPEGPIQQNSYSFDAGVEGGSVQFTGVAGVSLNRVGVHGQVEDAPQIPTGLLAGVLGAATTQLGVFGFSREGDGIEAASFTGTAHRAASFFGPGINSLSGALTGVTGISGTQGPTPVGDLPTIAGVLGTSDEHLGVLGTSTNEFGVAGYSANAAGVYGETGATGPNSYAGFFKGNLLVTGQIAAGIKDAIVLFPDGSKRLLHCMESPEHWFEDFGTARLKRGRAVVKLDADFAKVIKRGDYRVFPAPEGDCRGLFVRRKSATTFEVRELMGGKSSIAFSYRIVGRRKDIKEHRRFAKIDTRLPIPPAVTRTATTQADRDSAARIHHPPRAGGA